MVAQTQQLADELKIELNGDIDRLLPLVYEELKLLARRQRRFMPSKRDTTSLVHDAYLKLARQDKVDWRSRRQFFYLASLVMRHLLIDEARKSDRNVEISSQLAERVSAVAPPGADILALDHALEKLVAESPRLVDVVNCRFFGGLSIQETSNVLEISPATVKRDWKLARAWLYQNVREQ